MKPVFSIAGAVLIAAGLTVSAGLTANAVETTIDDAPAVQTDAALDSAACVAGGGDVVNGTSLEAKLAAETAAHKALIDPNNQLGDSLQGHTPGPVTCITVASADTSSTEALE